MKKCINGKYIEMTDEERTKSKERLSKITTNRGHSRNNNNNYEERIAALEAQIAKILTKLNESKIEENEG